MEGKQVKKFVLLLFIFTTGILTSEVFIFDDETIILGKLIKMDEDSMTIITGATEFVTDRDSIIKIYRKKEDYVSDKENLDNILELKKNMTTYQTHITAYQTQMKLLETELEQVKESYKLLVKEKLKDKVYSANQMIFVRGGISKSSESNYFNKNVSISDFYISKYEVTQKEWVDVMGKNPSFFEGDGLPVETVSWYDIIDYCNKRSIKEKLKPYYVIDKTRAKEFTDENDKVRWFVSINNNANGYRLPTEAEWEYAATGGQNSKNFTFSGGDNIDDVAYHKGNNNTSTRYVGEKKANELGIYDMSGNVWEWCWDRFGEEIPVNVKDPKGPTFGNTKVIRSGSWNYAADVCSINYRTEGFPYKIGNGVGFRVVKAP